MRLKTTSSSPGRTGGYRHWRFSLRTLLVLVLAAAFVSAGLGWRWRRAQRQAVIVNALRSTGASVMYDYQIHTSDEGSLGRFTIIPQFLRDMVGDDFFSEIHALHVGGGGKRCSDALGLAAPLRQIRSLSIQDDAVVRRDALAHLSCWEQLTDLRIDGCDVRDEDLAPLARAVNVVELHLHRQPIGNDALAHLRNMRKLRCVGLGATNVTDDGLAELASFPELQDLWLFEATGVSDQGMVHVGRCSKLRFLELSGTAVGDEGLKHLSQLQDLRYLNAGKTSVTDAGLKHLTSLANLEEGLFYGTTVTQAGIDQVPSLVASKKYNVGNPSISAAVTSSPAPAP